MTSGPHPREEDRLAALHSLAILDTPRESDFDDVVKILADICEVPISLITLLDRDSQWFKAAVGVGDLTGTPREISVCTHAVLQDDLFVVPDTRQDPRFAQNPLVTGDTQMRFYAGVPLLTEDGLPIGTVCVLDTKPRLLDERQQRVLRLMAKQVMVQIRLRHEIAERRAAETQQQLLIAELHHRVKNTLATVQAVIQLSMRSATDLDMFRDSIVTRIASLANTHTLLSERSWSAVPFRALLTAELRPYENTGAMRLDGPDFQLSAQTAVAVGMIIHEMTTNASKYGALSREAGKLDVTWTLKADDTINLLDLTWRETGGPAVTTPARRGFGSMLLQRIVEGELRGKVTLDYAPGGLTAHLTARLPKPAE